MSIIKEIVLDSGVTVSFHRIGRVTFTNSSSGIRASTLVSSWISQTHYDNSSEEIYTEVLEELNIIPTEDIFNSVEVYLTTNTNCKYYEGNIVSDTIVVPLEVLKASRWNILKAIRDKLERTTFTWNSNVFDSDEVSKVKLTLAGIKAVKALQSEESYNEYWTLADNSVILLSAQDMVDVLEALGNHIRNVHYIGRTLRIAIEEATTEEEVLAIVWPV